MITTVEVSLNPKVSIITPVYNSSSFISQMMKSVLNQTYENWEIVLVDDCSSDDSVEIIKSFMKDEPRIRLYLLDENSGSGLARNKAIEEASGRYIAFLDSDDIWAPEKLSIQIEFMLSNGIAFSHTSYGYINELGNKIKTTFKVRTKVTYHDLLKRTEISCLTAVYDSLLIGKYYMSEHRRKQDYALWLSILKNNNFSYGIDKELAYYRQVKNSATSKKYKLIIKHILFFKETQDFSTIKAIYYTFYWFKNGIIRYFIK
jgi:teichuronic acid biosynthesis glycosyltransferase TuaG